MVKEVQHVNLSREDIDVKFTTFSYIILMPNFAAFILDGFIPCHINTIHQGGNIW